MIFKPFWLGLSAHGERLALVDPATSRTWSYRALDVAVWEGSVTLAAPHKKLLLFRVDHSAAFLLAYLSALRAGHAIMLVDRKTSEAALANLLQAYTPDQVFWSQGEAGCWAKGYVDDVPVHGYSRARQIAESPSRPHPDLALVMPTSGSTGGPRAVRLSAQNLAVNAHQIRLSLDIGAEARAATTLPFSYIFGLSVVHSHLASGAAVVVSPLSVLQPDFWAQAHDWNVTSMAGVTFTFELFRRLGLARKAPSSLTSLTHSGGRLTPVLSDWLRDKLAPRFQVHLMYGMTEGAGRLCVLPPSLLAAKPGSVGFSVPWGQVVVEATGEVIFTGPNVMMGYAKDREDLARGDDCAGVLRTGDLGRVDGDGCLFLSGRISRFCKFFGRRYSLDDIETRFSDLAEVAAIADGSGIVVCHHRDIDDGALAARAAALAHEFGLPQDVLRLASLASVPRTAGGKIAYAILKETIGRSQDGGGFTYVD